MSTFLRRVACTLALLLLTVGMVRGQELRGRVSLQMKGSSIQESVAPGLHLDALLPITGGFSIVAGGGVSAFLLKGRTNGRYTFDPELTLRVTLPSRSLGATTIFGGGGYHVPLTNSEGAGPTIQLGVGRVWALRESTLFLDLAPTVIVRQEAIAVLMPIRAGVVF